MTSAASTLLGINTLTLSPFWMPRLSTTLATQFTRWPAADCRQSTWHGSFAAITSGSLFAHYSPLLIPPLAEAETETTAWFAIKLGAATFGIVDFFRTADGRQAHLDGPIASALMAKADALLSSPPDIKPIDVLAAKLPG